MIIIIWMTLSLFLSHKKTERRRIQLTNRLGARGAPGAAKLEHVPVKHVVVGETLAVKQISKQLPRVRVVGFLFEPQRSGVEEKRGKFT